MQRIAISAVAAITIAAGCGKKNDKDPASSPTTGEGSTAKPAEPGKRGADSADAAAKAMLDAIVKMDLDAAKRMVPDAEACKALPELAVCPQIATNLEKSWDQIKTVAPGYATATLAEAAGEAAPVPGGEVWVATATGVAPMKFVAMKVGDRFYAPIYAGGGAKPPSTGNEMPDRTVSMTPEQARKVVDEAVALMEKPEPPCDQIVDALATALPIAFPGDTVPKEAVPGITAMGKCASKIDRWRAVIGAGTALLDVSDDEKIPSRIVRALAEMGEYDKAIATANELAKKYPKSQAMLTAALTFVYCRAEAWDKCEKTGETALAALAKAGVDPNDDAVLINRVLRDLAWVVTGKPKQALKDFDEIEKFKGTPPPAILKIKAEAERAIERGYYFEAVPVPQLPTGVYHLMGRQNTGALVTFKIVEHAGKPRKFRIEVEVPGVTERSANTLELGKRESTVKWANPPLKMDFDVGVVRSPRPTQLAIKVVELDKDGDKTVLDETVPIEVLPRDYLPLKRRTGADSFVPTFGFMGAWITSNDKSVEAFLTKAKDRVPTRSFVGEQDTTVPQIKAIYDELKSRGVSYVMDPNVTSEQAFVQRTRLPAEVLASTNAQCLEGTLLFATLMESIGVRPIIVVVPGHAFVGWHTVAKDGTKGEPLFVETTMVGVAPFEAAVDVATKRVMQEMKTGAFKSGASTLIDVAAIRQQGFTAQPM